MFGFLNKITGPKVDLSEKIAEGALILDVRTKGEYASGHVKGSKNIPLDQLQGQINSLKKQNKVVITCCASGMRSGTAKSILQSSGIECYNGGSWVSVQRLVS
ncbi:MAG: rhodanese-like domain-containing protein [Bacteroidetes bacterium]|nr:rhodanese-like domain-containing protein [Bacteroidota bacterium]